MAERVIKLVATFVVATLGVFARGPELSLGAALSMMGGVALLGLLWALEEFPAQVQGGGIEVDAQDERGEPVSDMVTEWKDFKSAGE